MTSKISKCTITVDDEMQPVLNELKKRKYYDKPHTAMYRDLLKLGVEAMKQQDTKAATRTA